MPLNKASGEPAINVSAAMFIAGSPDALFQGVWDTTDFEKEADQTTNPRWDKPHAMNLFIGLVQPRSDDGPGLVLARSCFEKVRFIIKKVGSKKTTLR